MSKRAYHNYWVYIITNKLKGMLYIGVTGGIDDRMEGIPLAKVVVLLQNINLLDWSILKNFNT
jgi:hypothetical protein